MAQEEEQILIDVPPPPSSSDPPRKIKKVPALLLAEEKEENHYYPKVVSIGPYHHGKPELALVEAFKPEAVNLFVSARRPELVNNFYRQVQIGEVRNHYESVDANYSDDNLAQMMLYDASLIILFMELRVNKLPEVGQPDTMDLRRKSEAVIGHLDSFTVGLLFQDLFLLENQIPFTVMKLLMELLYGKENDELRKLTESFVNDFSFCEDQSRAQLIGDELHLLEFTHKVITFGATPRRRLLNDDDRVKLAKSLTHSFRRVTDLQAKGIEFRPSATQSVMDVQFSPGLFQATLHLPSWIVTDDSEALFKNLVAYELLGGGGRVVASYIDIMKSLIVSGEDVKELRERKVLYTPGSSDEEVVNMYKNIKVYGSSDITLFLHVREQIQDHYGSRIKTWMADLKHTYFNSPWTIVAVIAAAAALGMSAAQLQYAKHPPK